MNTGAPSTQDLLEIVKLIELSSEFNEFHLKYGEVELHLLRQGATPSVAAEPAFAPVREAIVAPATAAPAPPLGPSPAAGYPPHAVLVKSPMVGSFYLSPAPGAPPFVTVGERVTAEQTVCIIEVMKLMNSIPAGQAGVVTHILAGDAEPVEFGQVLVVIDPEA